MDTSSPRLKNRFDFGTTRVRILQGDALAPGFLVDALVSSDDNYFTMGAGLSGALRRLGGGWYIKAAQAKAPARVGTVVSTRPYGVAERLSGLQRVLHAAVIDYDTDDVPLEQVVHDVTRNSLLLAEELGLVHLLMPAFATGSGGLAIETCARQMCRAIKAYLAQERPIETLTIMLHLPREEGGPTPRHNARAARNLRFLRQANLVLDVPYDPTSGVRQTRDFFGRAEALCELEALVCGAEDEDGHKRHVVVLGGPDIGKWALVDELYRRSFDLDSPLNRGRMLVKLSFGRIHEGTPVSFVYQKLLRALAARETDPGRRSEFIRACADVNMDGRRFMRILDKNADRYPEVVFLLGRLPPLLRMERLANAPPGDVRAFWRDLEVLERRVRFVYTALDDGTYRRLWRERLSQTGTFGAHIRELRLRCISVDERRAWVNALYRRYLDREPTESEQQLVAHEAGRHPALIGLVGHALITSLKRDLFTNPAHPTAYSAKTLTTFFQSTRATIETPRRAFFDTLLARASREERLAMEALARRDVGLGDDVLTAATDMRDTAHGQRPPDTERSMDARVARMASVLRRLEERGYLVDVSTPETAQFMAPAFGLYVTDQYGVGCGKPEVEGPRDVSISLLRPEPRSVQTLYRARGARIITAQKELSPAIKDLFVTNLDRFLNHLVYPGSTLDPGAFADLEQVGHFILSQFTTTAIKSSLQSLPDGSTVSFEVEDELEPIPWELMLESMARPGIPFCVGRRSISQRQASNLRPPVRGDRLPKALLIGDPTDDLPAARHEVENLADRLRTDGRFAEPDVYLGSARCDMIPLLNALQSGRYALVHYAGHSHYDGYQSAWVMSGETHLTTNLLTNALQGAPPALVFSSSCESAHTGEPRPLRYEDQAHDLPEAFLQAGVESYVGTLWAVGSASAGRIAAVFYDALLGEPGITLGECLRRAKESGKARGDHATWPAYVLYGDPRTRAAAAFPSLANAPQAQVTDG